MKTIMQYNTKLDLLLTQFEAVLLRLGRKVL